MDEKRRSRKPTWLLALWLLISAFVGGCATDKECLSAKCLHREAVRQAEREYLFARCVAVYKDRRLGGSLAGTTILIPSSNGLHRCSPRAAREARKQRRAEAANK